MLKITLLTARRNYSYRASDVNVEDLFECVPGLLRVYVGSRCYETREFFGRVFVVEL